MTADPIALRAAERPADVAVMDNGHAVSFADFSADIRRAMRAVHGLGVRRGGSVAIGTGDLYLHWLLLLACERLGIGAASFLASEPGGNSAALLASVDLVLGEPQFPSEGARRLHAITPAWCRHLLALPPADEEPSVAPEDPVRILRTSGTLGAPKRVVVLRRMHEAMIAEGIACFGLSPRTRYLQSLPLTVRASYDFGSGSLRMGGTLVLETGMGTVEAVRTHGVTHAIQLPVQLNDTVETLSSDYARPPELTILGFGTAIPAALHAKATERFATAVCDLYGTVEVGAVSVAWGDDPGFGKLWPGVEVQAVDGQDRSVPHGEPGHLRIKAPWMCDRYADNPEATQRMFRDGWFYPGDDGLVRADGALKILGRTDDLLNLGGQKVSPAELEAILLNHGIAGDVGVCSILTAAGVENLCVAVANPRDDGSLMKQIWQAVQPPGSFYVVTLARIPRSANGKVERKRLKEEVVHAMRAGR